MCGIAHKATAINHRLLRSRRGRTIPPIKRRWLEWRVSPNEASHGTTTLRQRARFHPRSIVGRLYWRALLFPHAVIWRQLIKRLARAAEQGTDVGMGSHRVGGLFGVFW